MKNKKGQFTLVFGAVFLALLLIGGIWYFAAGPGEGKLLSQAADSALPTNCESTTTPNLTIAAYDADNVGTALTEATNLQREVGKTTWNTFTAGTGFAASVGKAYEIVPGISTSDQTDNAYGEYFITSPVACEETPQMEIPMHNDEIETELTATFWNADGVASTAEVFVADQTQTVSIKLLTGSDQTFGNPFIKSSGVSNMAGQNAAYPNIVCAALNSTAFDTPEAVSFDGVTMKKVAVPTRHAATAGHTDYCYTAPVVDDTLMENDRYLMRLNADASVAPTSDDTISIYAAGYYINAEDGDVYWGVEDEDGTAVGTDAADTVTADFT